ncbi:hypothetical protein [[Phormidium] sp. ETS-05]|uniref:hypothetical protein n=1 Tax=[Phormidium] sp. ETS-05 TaxID=222819 RepID=UPI0018EF2632|nr:hypothetical protein [[Phormidium] sp. ETS-05]
MKGYIKGKTIIITEPFPPDVKDGDEVEVSFSTVSAPKYPFPTFPLKIKDEYLHRESIYERD